jgi:hypothetical protein
MLGGSLRLYPTNLHASILFSLLVAEVVVLGGCGQSIVGGGRKSDTIPTIRQGVYGYVKFCEGDFMPTSPPDPSRGTITPVARSIVIHTSTRFDSATAVGYSAFYREIFTPEVAEASSNGRGFFQIELPVGSYSLFVVEDSLFYANGGDGQGHLCPATVFSDSLTFVELNITYRASF